MIVGSLLDYEMTPCRHRQGRITAFRIYNKKKTTVAATKCNNFQKSQYLPFHRVQDRIMVLSSHFLPQEGGSVVAFDSL